MKEELTSSPIINTAVRHWAAAYFQTNDIAIYLFPDEDDEPDRLIAVIAARGQVTWQAVEVWVETGGVASINPLGEGVPPEGVAWPWLEHAP